MARIIQPEFIIISGSGKKVGKTHLAVALIRTFSARFPLLALKISPHVHDSLGDSQLVAEAEGIRIFRDMAPHRKNSGQFLGAGARASFFMETEDIHLKEAFALFMDACNPGRLPVICESGALGIITRPGALVFIDLPAEDLQKSKSAIRSMADLVLTARSFSVADAMGRISYSEASGFRVRHGPLNRPGGR